MKKFYINLDVLLDTRLGTIARHSQEAASKVIGNENYYLREHDNWELFTEGLITNDKFKELYADRGNENTFETLSSSVLTNIIPVIHRIIVDELSTHLDNSGSSQEPILLTLDIAPYVLDLNLKDSLVGILNELFGEGIDYELANIGLKQLTPKFIFDNYALVLIYDLHEWLRIHYSELVKIRAGEVNFIGPKLFERDVSELDLDYKKHELLKFKIDHLVCMNFDFINAEYFSIVKMK